MPSAGAGVARPNKEVEMTVGANSYGGDTPRTDAITQMAQKCGEDSSVVDADFARQLEIERNSYALAAEKAVMKNAALSRAIGTPVAWQAKHPGDGYEWFQTTKEVFDSKGHGGYEYRELYAAVPAGMKFPERNDAPLTTGDLAWQRETQDRFARNPPNHMTSDVADTLPPSCGPKGEQDAGALAIEFVEQHPCPRWPNATALKCAKKGKEYPRCRYCDAARTIRSIPATGSEGSK